MFTKFVLPLVAVGGLAFAVFAVVQMQKPPAASMPLIEPAKRPTFNSIAGAGLVESSQRDIPIGTQVAGVIDQVFVEEGDYVKEGARLFSIEDPELDAELKIRRAELASKQAELARLEAGYREEDREMAKAAFEAAQARYEGAEVQFDRTRGVYERGAGTQSDYDRDRYLRDEAYASMLRANTEWEKLKRGSWSKDVAIAKAAVARAEAEMESTQVEIERRVVNAPIDGRVLQVNILPGQFAALAWNQPLIVLGDVTKLHVRVDIDEQDLPHFKAGARAVATLKGRPGVRFELAFVRVDPYVIPKRNLTGDNVERVDTRVLQVIYALPDQRPIDVFVGQQMDVYLEAADRKDLELSSNPNQPRPFEE